MSSDTPGWVGCYFLVVGAVLVAVFRRDIVYFNRIAWDYFNGRSIPTTIHWSTPAVASLLWCLALAFIGSGCLVIYRAIRSKWRE